MAAHRTAAVPLTALHRDQKTTCFRISPLAKNYGCTLVQRFFRGGAFLNFFIANVAGMQPDINVVHQCLTNNTGHHCSHAVARKLVDLFLAHIARITLGILVRMLQQYKPDLPLGLLEK